VPVLLLYAKWRTTGFKIEYAPGDGAWKEASDPVAEPETFALGVKAMLREGKDKLTPPAGQVFAGWTPDLSGQQSNAVWLPGAEIEMNGDALFTAYYTAEGNLIDVTYNSNADPAKGGDSPNLTDTRKAVKNKDFYPAGAASLGWADAQGAGTGANEGRKFLGWSENPYAPRPDNPQLFRTSGDPNDPLVLYAVWNNPNTDAVDDFIKLAEDPENAGTFTDKAVTYPAGTEELTFRISFTVPEDVRGWREVVLEDILPDKLRPYGDDPASAVQVTIDGSDPSPEGSPAQEGQSLRYRFADDTDWLSLAGKQVVMTVRAETVGGAAGKIENKARLVFNESEYEKPPGEPGGPPTVDAEPPDVNIEYPAGIEDLKKQAVSADGTALPEKTVQSEETAFPAGTEEIVYKISFRLPADTAGYRSVIVQDILPIYLEPLGAATEAVSVSVNGQPQAVTDDNTSLDTDMGNAAISHVLADTKETCAPLAGAEVAMTVHAKVKAAYLNMGIEKVTNLGRILVNSADDMGSYDPLDPDGPAGPSEGVTDPGVIIAPEGGEDFEFPDPIENLKKQAVIADGAALPGKAQSETTSFPAGTKNITYEISFKLPHDMTGYESILVQDILPLALELDGTEAVRVSVNGEPQTLSADNTRYADGVVTYVLAENMTAQDRDALADAEVVMRVGARVKASEQGKTLTLENKGRVLVNITDKTGRDDPLDPDGHEGPSAGVTDPGRIADSGGSGEGGGPAGPADTEDKENGKETETEKSDEGPRESDPGDGKGLPPGGGGTLLAQDDGSYLEIGPDGVPLGRWTYDPETETWIFEAFPPLGNMPQTGGKAGAGPYPPLAALLFLGLPAALFGLRKLFASLSGR
jgi:fimbrial isopeptide formation D2 family protein